VNCRKDLQVGVSFSNLLRPKIAHVGAYRLPVRTTFHALSEAQINRHSYADMSIIAIFQNTYYNARINSIVRGWRGLTFGAGYETGNSFYVLPGTNDKVCHKVKGFLGYSSQIFRILYSYDWNVNRSSGNTAGSHELSLEIKFKKKETTKSRSKGI
jgi:Type IX secretion system membrane protein PorP/SprF